MTTFKTPDNNLVAVVTNTYNDDVKLTISVPNNKNQIVKYTVIKRSITTFVWKI